MRSTKGSAAAAAAAVLALIAPTTAPAAVPARPGVTTGGAAAVTITTATLTGRVNPRGRPTTYFFQIGTTRAYGGATAVTAAGAGRIARAAAGPVSGLGPNTLYHYRLVAQNSAGTTRGADRTFKTPPQPLGLALSASPNPVGLGAPTTLAGNLSGTFNAGRAVQLQQNAFPFTAGFANLGNAQLTDAAGNFAFPILAVPLTTQYRVVVVNRPAIVSPVVTVAPQVAITTHVSRRRVKRGRKVRFKGMVRPAVGIAPVFIQKRGRHGRWRNVATTVTRPSTDHATYRKSFHLRRGGRFRVFVFVSSGMFASNLGRTIHLHTHR
jgi:hypothetical protein